MDLDVIDSYLHKVGPPPHTHPPPGRRTLDTYAAVDNILQAISTYSSFPKTALVYYFPIRRVYLINNYLVHHVYICTT